MAGDIWVLGATGRTGRAITRELAARGAVATLVGRDRDRLDAAAAGTDARRFVAGSTEEAVTAMGRERPAVVVNTVGPFQRTAIPIVGAALAAGAGYLDLANDIATVRALLARDAEARRAGTTIVTGAGFGVTATESVAVGLMADRGPAECARVDMIPSSAVEDGLLGEALTASLLEGLPGVAGGGRFAGRRIAGGRLTRSAIGSAPMRLTTPDGDEVTTASAPLGELLAAANATGAPTVDAASSAVPAGRLARALLPIGMSFLHVPPLRRFAIRRLAAVRTTARPRPRTHSWGHARIVWPGGEVREGWLRLGDAGDFTAAVAAEVAVRLATGSVRPGAFTPAALFGTDLAEACGGTYLPA